MAKKNQKMKKLVEEVEPFEPPVESTESGLVGPQGEVVPSESNSEAAEESVEVSNEGVETSADQFDSREDQVSEETSDATAGTEEESSEDDLLADVRQSLIEEESLEKEKQPKWWRKMGKSRKKDKVTQRMEPISDQELQSSMAEAPIPAIEKSDQNKESEEYLEQIDELIDMLEPTTKEEAPVSRVEEEIPTPLEPVQKVDIDELKKQAFRPRETGEEAESMSDVRSIALEGDEEVFVEVESKAEDPLQERLKAFENAIKPYRRYINIVFAFLGVVMAVIAGLMLYNFYQQLTPKATPVVSNLPYPTSVSLPGGWSFNLGKGALQDGQWNPQGAEWLQGTEVCRWVALPWSRQLEAVIRTLNPNDPIELVMSNNDKLVYKVYSVRQLSSEEMLKLDSNSPCLLLVLAEADSDSRWVLTALP